MNSPTLRRHLRLVTGAIALLAVAAAPLAQTVDNKPEVKKEILDRVTSLLINDAFVPGIDFHQWPAFLQAEQSKIDKANTDDEFAGAVNEALHKFGASHIVLTTPRMTDMRNTNSTVGIGISSQVTPDGLLVVRTVPGASADKAGLRAGDVIVKVEGKPVQGIEGIPGPEGTKVTITVKHPDGTVVDYTLVRHKFSTVRPEELKSIDKDTDEISIYTFDNSYNADRVESLMRKADQKKNLIVDLRDNPGGAVVNLQHFLGLLVPPHTPIGTFISKRMVDRYVEDEKGDPTDLKAIAAWSPSKVRPVVNQDMPVYKGHVAVLINGGSGSAAEICAAALHDTVGATLVGQKTAGAVLVSVIVPAADDFSLQYPLSDYVTIKGVRLEGNGVSPDIEANEPRYRLPGTPDDAVAKAVEALEHVAVTGAGRG